MHTHFQKLENMYMNAPVQQIYKGLSICVSENSAEISLPVDARFFHAGNSLHGSVYFRLLDDAAYFSANSMTTDFFMLTSSFHIEFMRPVKEGILTAKGRVIKRSKKLCLASSDLFDDKKRLVATGKGSFMKSNITLKSIPGYE